MQNDKRKQKRVETNLFVDLETLSGVDLGRGVVVDVSLSGLAMDTETDLTINDSVYCHIEVPLKLKAKVVRTIIEGQVKRYGLRFSEQGLIDKFLMKKILKGSLHTKKISR